MNKALYIAVAALFSFAAFLIFTSNGHEPTPAASPAEATGESLEMGRVLLAPDGGRWTFYKDAKGEWRWRRQARNNEIEASSHEGFKNQADAINNATISGYGQTPPSPTASPQPVETPPLAPSPDASATAAPEPSATPQPTPSAPEQPTPEQPGPTVSPGPITSPTESSEDLSTPNPEDTSVETPTPLPTVVASDPNATPEPQSSVQPTP